MFRAQFLRCVMEKHQTASFRDMRTFLAGLLIVTILPALQHTPRWVAMRAEFATHRPAVFAASRPVPAPQSLRQRRGRGCMI